MKHSLILIFIAFVTCQIAVAEPSSLGNCDVKLESHKEYVRNEYSNQILKALNSKLSPAGITLDLKTLEAELTLGGTSSFLYKGSILTSSHQKLKFVTNQFDSHSYCFYKGIIEADKVNVDGTLENGRCMLVTGIGNDYINVMNATTGANVLKHYILPVFLYKIENR